MPEEEKEEDKTPEKVEEKKEVHEEHTPKKGKKIDWMKLGILIIIVALILILIWPGGVLLHKSSSSTTLNVSYSAYNNGELLFSNSSSIQEGTFTETLGLISNKVDNELKNMQIDEEKNITLTTAEAYGNCDETQIYYQNRTIQEINRTFEQNRKINVSLTEFQGAFNETPILNKVYDNFIPSIPIKYKVIDISPENITLSLETEIGAELPSSYYSEKVISITEDTLTIRMDGNNSIVPDPSVGNVEIKFTSDKVTFILSPTIGQEIELPTIPKGIVTKINETAITVDSNPIYCGKDIILTIKLFSRTKEKAISGSTIKKIPGAPTMQVFIMSHCPYGTQMAKGIIPVWRDFLNKANIELRFVSYTMHGAQEDLDNSRLICVREEQSAKLIDYLDCFVHADGTENGAQTCISQVGLDKTKLDSCVADRAAGYFETDKQLNTQYGVQGSPTVIIDGKEVSIYPRDPASVAKALCDAFTGNKPSQCSNSYSTTNPAAGFGPDGSSNSSSGGSCS